MHYHATVKSNMLPLNDSGTPIIVLLSFISFFTSHHDLLIEYSLLAD